MYPELFAKQICRICGKEFYYNNNQICNIYNKNIINNKFNYRCCCKSHTQKLRNNILGNPYSKQNIRIKILEIKQNKYGDKNYNNRKKCHITKLNNIDENGLNSYDRASEKLKQINKSKYGCDWFISTEKFIKMSECTKFKKYGNKHYTNCKKAAKTKLNNIDENGLNSYDRAVINGIKTCQQKYNKSFYTQTDEYKVRNKQTWKNKTKEELELIKIKHIKKNNEKYGKDWFVQTEIRNNLYNNKHYVNKVMQKQYKSKRKNNSFNTSKPEDHCYELLKSKFNDVIRNYSTDIRYPFNCDFYIPSKDLFIECHFHWTHGGTQFNKDSQEHLKQLEKWRSKNTQFYKNAEKVWTERDPLKLKTFIDNKLNYKIFYKEEEFIEWFKGL